MIFHINYFLIFNSFFLINKNKDCILSELQNSLVIQGELSSKASHDSKPIHICSQLHSEIIIIKIGKIL